MSGKARTQQTHTRCTRAARQHRSMDAQDIERNVRLFRLPAAEKIHAYVASASQVWVGGLNNGIHVDWPRFAVLMTEECA